MTFQIRIANKRIGINSLYERVYFLCKNYHIHDTDVDFEINIKEEDIQQERKISTDHKYYSDDYLETLAVYRKIADYFLDYNTFLMHGSVIAVNDKAYMFIAPSGTGKTTHTRLWLKYIPDSRVINGDKPLIMLKDGKAYACGTPWCGKEGYNSSCIVPLHAICLLDRGENNEIQEISFLEAFPKILQQTYKPKESEAMIKTLHLIHTMRSCIKCYDLKCKINAEAAIMAYEYIEKNEILMMKQ